MFTIKPVRRRIAAAVATAQKLRSQRVAFGRFFVGLLAGTGLAIQLHEWSSSSLGLCLSTSTGVGNARPDVILAFTLYPVTSSAGQIAVLAVAVVVLIGFQFWSMRATSPSFFWGVLAGTGLVLSFDIVWVHWIFGLHHLTNTQLDLVFEPLFVLIGVAFLWFAIARELRQAK